MELGEISVPTLLLVGDADYPPLLQANREAAARIPGCELTVVPGMDHLPPCASPTSCCARSRARWPGPAGNTRLSTPPISP
jgi:pimeloyl-ACP methyl ester carboxylesterase